MAKSRGRSPAELVEVVNLEPELDRVFQQPLGQFVAARNALSARLKATGRRSDADAVQALAKPSASAWAINQVYWSARQDYDRLVEAGDRLREAQHTGLRGRVSDLRSAMIARQGAVDAVVERAVELLHASGTPASEATRRRMAVTCDAIAAHGSLPSRPHAGRLSADLDPPGFSLIASLAPASEATASVRPAPRQAASPAPGDSATPARPAGRGDAIARRAEDERARREARREARARAEFEAARADAEVKRRRLDAARASREAEAASGRAALANTEVESARARLESAERRAREAGAAQEAARRRADEAEAAVNAAETEASAARAALSRLGRDT